MAITTGKTNCYCWPALCINGAEFWIAAAAGDYGFWFFKKHIHQHGSPDLFQYALACFVSGWSSGLIGHGKFPQTKPIVIVVLFFEAELIEAIFNRTKTLLCPEDE